jgi:hypothetical protein
MHSVGEVDVQGAGFIKHRSITSCETASGVRRRIIDVCIGLNLGDQEASSVNRQYCAEQLWGHN